MNNRMHELSNDSALQMAINRIEDLLKGDDGQAFKEARKALPKLRAALTVGKPMPTAEEALQARAFRALIGAAWAHINRLPKTPPEQAMHDAMLTMNNKASRNEAIAVIIDALTKHQESRT